jgi:hypothetical protein
MAPTARLNDEIEIAVSELATFWLDAILLAWRRWGVDVGGVRLDAEKLMPLPTGDAKTHSQWSRWDSVVKQARKRLESAVAMSPADIDHVYRQFAGQVRRQIQDEKRPLELPNRVDLFAREGAPTLASRRT